MTSPYREERFELGSVRVPNYVDIPGEFGLAVKLIATLAVATFELDASSRGSSLVLHWWIEDTLDGDHWTRVGSAQASYSDYPCTTIRVSLPFANRLRIRLIGSWNQFDDMTLNPLKEGTERFGTLRGAVLLVGCQT